MAIEWTDELSVGHADIDHDHRETIDRIQDLVEAVDDESFKRLFSDFAEHLRIHFEMEQTLMKDNGFFAQVPHTKEHQRVLGGIDSLLKQNDVGDLNAARQYIEFDFPEWFLAHRATMDKVTADFLAG
ncbi:MAG: hemerythrin family protein [Rhodospirillaceae bacterium]|nr:hemerythrin family protein [Rhodospirillaceae bacterium]MBT4218899.1 hemerythrin family protein [Rhodospirillaceae bacterium]MBT5013378.1 hemerythrin family protein [Rhodospirillaceae bacterium]MBT5308281.1 hemerythrin family protein [Rhodospirillaceae bacterium]MBT6406746.1 hemerythrin family protein [Rhodospirillaceae bacterium]